jgi:hypothetical protein
MDAKIAEADMLQRYKEWLAGHSGDVTLRRMSEVMEWWKKTPTKSGKERTLDGAQGRYQLVLDRLGGHELHELYGALMRFIDELKGKGLKPATINRHIAIAKAAVHSAYEHRVGQDWHRLIPENYLSGFPTLPENNIRHCILSPEQRSALYDELVDYLRPLFFHASYYPCRKEEITMTRKSDVNMLKMKIWLPAERSKTGRPRWIPIPMESREFVISSMDNSSEYLYSFRSPLTGRWAPITDFDKAWNGACRRAAENLAKMDKEFPDGYNWHKTRQQSAMELMYDGWDTLQVMHVGGWKSLTAFRRYVDVDEIMLDIKQGMYTPDLSWRQKHAPQSAKKAA